MALSAVKKERVIASLRRADDRVEVQEFDYGGLDAEKQAKLNELGVSVRKTCLKSIMEIGGLLSEARDVLAKAGKEGRFSAWLSEVCGIDKSTAYNYLKAYSSFSDVANLEQFTAGAIYKLAATATPELAVAKAIKLADKGEKITKKKAAELVAEYTIEEAAEEVAVIGAAPPPPTAEELAGPCPAGGEHEFDAEACVHCHEPKPATPEVELSNVLQLVQGGSTPPPVKETRSAKLFDEMVALLGKAVRTLDDLNNAHPHPRMYQSIKDSLDLAFDDVRAYRTIVRG